MLSELKYENKDPRSKKRAPGAVFLAIGVAVAFAVWAFIAW